MGVVYRKKKAAPTQQVYLTPEDIKSRYTDWFDPSPHPRPAWDGLQVSWGERAFCNPPWCNIRPWVEKALQERDKGCVVHMLTPQRPAQPHSTISSSLKRAKPSFLGGTHHICV